MLRSACMYWQCRCPGWPVMWCYSGRLDFRHAGLDAAAWGRAIRAWSNWDDDAAAPRCQVAQASHMTSSASTLRMQRQLRFSRMPIVNSLAVRALCLRPMDANPTPASPHPHPTLTPPSPHPHPRPQSHPGCETLPGAFHNGSPGRCRRGDRARLIHQPRSLLSRPFIPVLLSVPVLVHLGAAPCRPYPSGTHLRSSLRVPISSQSRRADAILRQEGADAAHSSLSLASATTSTSRRLW